MGNLKVLLLVPLALLLLAPISFAISERFLADAYDDTKCLTDFETSIVSSVTSRIPEASYLSTYADKLTADTAQLETYANANDTDAFKNYMRGTYEPDVRSTNDAIRDARKNFSAWNVTVQTRKDMKDSYDSAKDAFKECHLDAMKKMANGRVEHYKDVLEKWTDKANDLSAKGIDTSGMMSVINGAQTTIVTPLEDALDSATTGKEVADAVRGYCLANGCKNGLNYHFYGKIEEAKLQGVLDYIEPNATAAGLGSQVDAAQSNLDTAQITLNAVGTGQYSGGQEKIVWDSLKDAAKTIKAIMKSLRNQTS